MTTQTAADISLMHQDYESQPDPARRMPEATPHAPRSHRTETPAARAARIAALTKAVRNGSYDTLIRARLGADALCDTLMSGGRPRR